MSRIRVLLIEDDYYSRYALYSLISRDPRTSVVDEVKDVDEARWLLGEDGGRLLPDVILFDVDMFCQDRDPLEALEELTTLVRQNRHHPKIICCLMDPTLTFIRASIALGVDGIVKKEEMASRVADVVEQVHLGCFVYSRSVSEKAFGRIQGVQHTRCYQVQTRRTVPLSRRLRRIARLYCEDNLTAKEVGEILHLSESGVRRQIRQVYRVLGAHSRGEARSTLQELA